jgi:hypothetical protein
VTIYALLKGELPPRHLPGIEPGSSVEVALTGLRETFQLSNGASYVLSFEGKTMTDVEASLASYDVPDEALVFAEPDGPQVDQGGEPAGG